MLATAMETYRYRRISWTGFLLSFVVGGLLVAVGYLLFDGGATLTLWLVAAIAFISPFANAVQSIRVEVDTVTVRQGVWGEGVRVPLDQIAAAEVVAIPRQRRYLRVTAPGGVEVISAGAERGVELRLAEPRRARFARKQVSRLVLGTTEPEALLEAIEAARRV